MQLSEEIIKEMDKMKINDVIDTQTNELLRGTVDIVEPDELRNKLIVSQKTGVPLIIKAGFDPTAPDLHLGHTVLLNKLRQFQKLGHTVVFVVGDFTAKIGDPTGKGSLRPALSDSQIIQNSKTYTDQAFKILDPEKTKISYNSSWLGLLSSSDIIKLMANMTVSRMLERDDFKKRFRGNTPIYLHEMLYPLLQGYDSVAIHADVELGGTDQLFNLFVGRLLQKQHHQPPQVVMTMPLLEGLDGKNKMSKSLGNYIGIAEDANLQFAKAMSIPDSIMWRYFDLVTDFSNAQIDKFKEETKSGVMGMKEAKEMLSFAIVERFWDSAKAENAKEHFDKLFSKKEIPEDIKEMTLVFDNNIELATLLKLAGLSKSRSEAKRKIKEGAVYIDSVKIDKMPKVSGSFVIKLGRKIIRIKQEG